MATYNGTNGKDTLNGGATDDVIDGNMGNDSLSGLAGNDFLYGSTGNDTLNGGDGNDYVSGGIDNDVLYGGAGSDLLDGGDGDDKLYDTSDATTYGVTATESDELIGGNGNDTMYGGYDAMHGDDGDDTIYVKNQATVFGGTGNDTITVSNSTATLGSWLDGELGSDSITGGAGDDTLIAGYGNDTLVGAGGNDTYVMTFDGIADTINGGLLNANDKIIETATGGTDTIYYIRDFLNDGRDDDFNSDNKELNDGTKVASFEVVMPDNVENVVLDDKTFINQPSSLIYFPATLIGNELANTITGSNLDDTLDGVGGNDSISAGAGNDTIFVGDDKAINGATVTGGTGTDTINGGAGTDTVVSPVSYSINGNTKAISIENIDLLDGTASTATGDNNNNVLWGNNIANTLTGNGGNDTLDGWYYGATVTVEITGNDKLDGGTGNDVYRIDAITDNIVETGAIGGVDTVSFRGAKGTVPGAYILPTGVENITIVSNLKEADGNSLNNRMIGDSSINTLVGAYGDDYLDGGSGLDSLVGGYGDDTLVIDNVLEKLIEFPMQGNDWAQSGKVNINLQNWVDIENARLTDKTDLNITGNNADNILLGNAGKNSLEGVGSTTAGDTLKGGLGNDIYIVDSTTDKLTESNNAIDSKTKKVLDGWIDTVQSFVDFNLTTLVDTSIVGNKNSDFENLTLMGSAINGTGDGNDNVITGNNSNNSLVGNDGNDTLEGQFGADTLVGGAGDDTYIIKLFTDDKIVESDANSDTGGHDTINSEASVTLSTSYANVENITLSGNGKGLIATGNNLDNVLTGNEESNSLISGAGNDTLIGNSGEDTLNGGAGADTFDLTEKVAAKDIVRIALGDSNANTAKEADQVIKFDLVKDYLDLDTIAIAPNTPTYVDGDNLPASQIKSHLITNGIIRFDDNDKYTAPVAIKDASSSDNIADVIDYLRDNISGNVIVAFQAGSNVWVFQDGGATDTLVELVGASSTVLTNISSVHIS